MVLIRPELLPVLDTSPGADQPASYADAVDRQQRLATRTTLAPWWIRWLLLPHHVNYHLEHHLYPAVPHYRLAQCHREARAAGMHEGAEVATLAEATRKFFADPAPAAAAD